MTAIHLSAHVTAAGDSVDSIVARYRLSSRAAFTTIPANRHVTPLLAEGGELPAGLLVYIPPRAMELIRQRLYVLHAVRPTVISHFDDLRDRVAANLRPVLLAAEGFDDSRIGEVLAALDECVSLAVGRAAEEALSLVGISRGLVHTHIAADTDHAAAGTIDDPLCSLYLLLTPPILGLWQGLWTTADWLDRWQGQTPEVAVSLADRQLNTISTLVVQQVDQRIREAQRLEAQIRSEA